MNFIIKYPILSPLISSFLTACIGCCVALFTIKKQRQTARENNSLSFEKDYKRCTYVRDAWDILIKNVISNKLTTPVERYADKELASTVEAKAIRDILNEWERAANAVSFRLYDDDFLYNAFGSTVIFLRTELTPYIEVRQAENKSFYQHFMRLSLRWKIKKDARVTSRTSHGKLHDTCVCRKCLRDANRSF